MGWEVGGWFKSDGTYVYLWLIHADVWQKPAKFCKAIILQLKNKLKINVRLNFLKKTNSLFNPFQFARFVEFKY